MRVSRLVILLIPVIAGATLTVLTSAALGSLVTRAVGFSGGVLSRAERLTLGFGVGAASLSTIVFLMCALHLVHPASFTLVAAGIFAAYWRWARDASSTADPLEASRWIRDWRCWVYLAITFAYGGVYLIYALAPEITSDAVAYHLGLVRRYYNTRAFPASQPTSMPFFRKGRRCCIYSPTASAAIPPNWSISRSPWRPSSPSSPSQLATAPDGRRYWRPFSTSARRSSAWMQPARTTIAP